jgi:hypothetical protein
MGYTHYYLLKKPAKGQSSKIEAAYQKAVLDCQKIIKSVSKSEGGLSGYTAHSPIGAYGGILVNGSENSGKCEDFLLREHFSQNEAFNFTKTNRYQYDTVVVACLCVLSFRLKGLVEVSSDGSPEDWAEGLALARKVLKLKSLGLPTGVLEA